MTDIWNLPSNISSIYIGQKEIQSIVQTKDSTVLYQKSASHTYLLTAQLSPSTIYTDGSTIISGVLTDNGSAMANETITIYDGNTSLGTCTTDSNGAYSKTLSGFNSGNHTLKASHTNVDSSTVSLTVNNHSYSLTATLGSASIYTDGSTTISGKLTLDGSPSPYQTLTLYDGNSVLETFYTDVQGNYSRTLSGLSVGTHTLKVSHSNVNSSNVTLTVANHTYAISVSANPVTITSGQSSIISATLTKDSSAYSGQTVTFSYGGNSYTSTTDVNGVATYTYTGTGAGSVTITASSNGASNTVTITDNQSGGSTPTSISVSTTKDILSKSHSDTSTLTATVLDANNNPCNGETVTFKKDSTVLGTDTTDANGEAEYTYSAIGNGDITITIECDSIIETYNLSDYLLVPPLNGADTITKWTNATNTTGNGVFKSHGSYLSNGWDNTGLWQLDFDVKTSSWWYVGLMPICVPAINPFTDAKNNTYSITCWEGFTCPNGMGFSNIGNAPSYTKKTATNTTYHMTIKKTASNRIEIILENNSNYTWIKESSLLSNYSTLYFGSRDNPSSRKSGGILQFSNIVVKPL